MSVQPYYNKDLQMCYPSSESLINYSQYTPYSYFNLMYQLKYGDCGIRPGTMQYKNKIRK